MQEKSKLQNFCKQAIVKQVHIYINRSFNANYKIYWHKLKYKFKKI